MCTPKRLMGCTVEVETGYVPGREENGLDVWSNRREEKTKKTQVRYRNHQRPSPPLVQRHSLSFISSRWRKYLDGYRDAEGWISTAGSKDTHVHQTTSKKTRSRSRWFVEVPITFSLQFQGRSYALATMAERFDSQNEQKSRERVTKEQPELIHNRPNENSKWNWYCTITS